MKDTIDIQLNNKVPITNEQFILRLDNMISEFPEESRNTYLSIIKEELDGELNYKLGCPNKKIEIFLMVQSQLYLTLCIETEQIFLKDFGKGNI